MPRSTDVEANLRSKKKGGVQLEPIRYSVSLSKRPVKGFAK